MNIIHASGEIVKITCIQLNIVMKWWRKNGKSGCTWENSVRECSLNGQESSKNLSSSVEFGIR